ncbi:plasminogen-binding group A steptococcal M-like protein PAM [Streptococcus pyogenes]|uniref:YSIRK-type signal peptide-containing protein n=1 Tax=Streptococcus pyogenes TaxID=1314 RepID=UPI00109C2E3B|nr:YSIRK-type signal peptide-containing protein [Streptococcus pyogenes]VHG96638.1 plasminogen-binding group A steptococcal M-like protein PAM [Streptococcus pyogenes]
MVRKDTNRHYSLRKLKKGTASVAVALSVLGAGLASQTEVKADNVGRVDVDKIREEALHQAIGGMTNVQLRNTLAGSFRMNDELKKTIQEKEQELKNLKDNVELEQLKNERHDHDEEAERKALEDKLADKQEHLDGALRYINEKEAERKALEDKLADKQEHLDGALRYINEKEAERKEKEAEQKKLKEEKQISDASRQGLRRDLDASREAKKQVEKALEEANSKLAALEKLNKELEESKKLTEKEKAELQAKLEAEAKALKEQLAKQAEELAKLRAEKASDSQTPDAKPGNKAVPGKGQAPQAGTKPNQNKAPMKETKRQLPSTGEAANPFFTAAALTVMATAGVAAVVKRKEEN